MSSAGAALQRRGENLREGRWGEDGGRASLGEVWTGGGSERVGLFGTFVSLGTAANDRSNSLKPKLSFLYQGSKMYQSSALQSM